MSKFLIILFIVVVVMTESQAQNTDASVKVIDVSDVRHFDELPDSAFKPKRARTHRINYGASTPLIFINGSVYTGAIDKITPDYIENIDLLNDSVISNRYGKSKLNGILKIKLIKGVDFDIVTNLIKVDSTLILMFYHRKLSYLSKQYAADLETRHGDDSEYLYIINGKVISDKPDKVYLLNKIPVLSIKSVNFTPAKEAVGSPAVVLIKTEE